MRSLSLSTRRRLAAHLFVIALLVAWAAASLRMPGYVLPAPLTVLQQAGAFLVSAKLAGHIVSSIFHVAAALALAFLAGTVLALAGHYLPITRVLIGRLAAFLNSFSSIGWALLAILWFGLNDASVIFVIGIVILPIYIINIQAALDQLDAELIEMTASFTRSWPRAFAMLVLPALYPFMLATTRLAFGIAWKVALTAELFGGNSGFGFLINIARQDIDTPRIFAVIAWMIVISYLADHLLFAPLERYVTKHYADA
jgi:NitT/TauT family transport system permease protein/sulfonate transport system permease protein